MAGHSQFKNIMYRKGAQDKKRARLFTTPRPRDHGGGARGPARPRGQSAAARGDGGGARRQHAEGQHRARHQARDRRRGRHQFRRGALRGLWAGRRRHHRRGADRQPQPHRLVDAHGVQQARRQSRRDQQRHLHVPARRQRSPFRRTRRPPTTCSRPRSRPAPATSPRAPTAMSSPARPKISYAVRETLEARFGAPTEAQLLWRPTQHRAGRRRQREYAAQAARGARGQTTTCSRSRPISRSPTTSSSG